MQTWSCPSAFLGSRHLRRRARAGHRADDLAIRGQATLQASSLGPHVRRLVALRFLVFGCLLAPGYSLTLHKKMACVNRHSPRKTALPPQGSPETLDLAQRLRPTRRRHHLLDATLVQLLAEGA